MCMCVWGEGCGPFIDGFRAEGGRALPGLSAEGGFLKACRVTGVGGSCCGGLVVAVGALSSSAEGGWGQTGRSGWLVTFAVDAVQPHALARAQPQLHQARPDGRAHLARLCVCRGVQGGRS